MCKKCTPKPDREEQSGRRTVAAFSGSRRKLDVELSRVLRELEAGGSPLRHMRETAETEG